MEYTRGSGAPALAGERAEEKRKKKPRTKKHTPKVKESGAHKQTHARLLHENHGEGADSRGTSSSGPPHKGNREVRNSLDWWLLKSGSRTDISQGAKPDRSRPSAGRTDGDPRPQLQNDTQGSKAVTSSPEGEKGMRARTKNEVGEDIEEKAEMTTTSEKQDTGNGARLNRCKMAAGKEETCGSTPGRAED